MNEQNETVTKDVFAAGIDHLARLVNAGFLEMEKRTAKQEDLLVLIQRVENIEKDLRVADNKFDAVFLELREIRNQIKEIDTRADVMTLEIRVGKLEKKLGIRP